MREGVLGAPPSPAARGTLCFPLSPDAAKRNDALLIRGLGSLVGMNKETGHFAVHR
jgi:hypothetical protein